MASFVHCLHKRRRTLQSLRASSFFESLTSEGALLDSGSVQPAKDAVQKILGVACDVADVAEIKEGVHKVEAIAHHLWGFVLIARAQGDLEMVL